MFFAFFMLNDPPTSPVRYPDQIVCGLIVAVASFAVYMTLGAVYFLLAGLLVGNAWETGRRIFVLARPQRAIARGNAAPRGSVPEAWVRSPRA